MTIIDEEADVRSADAQLSRPWWFGPALIGIALGGVIGASVAPSPETARGTPTERPSPTLAIAPRDAVLTPEEIPPGFEVDAEGDPKFDEFQAIVSRRQYVEGWLRLYARTDPTGRSSIWSESTMYETEPAAARALTETRAALLRFGYVETPLSEVLGDESYAMQSGANGESIEFDVVFRVANVTNHVAVVGSRRSYAGAVELAKKQLARLR